MFNVEWGANVIAKIAHAWDSASADEREAIHVALKVSMRSC